MRFHSLWKILVAGMGCGLLAAACSAPDPGAYSITDKTPHTGASSGATSGGTSSGASGTTSGSSGTTSGSSGSSGSSGIVDAGVDTGFDAGPPVPAAFKGAPKYVATPGQATTNANHGTADNEPPNHDCFSCHKNGGAGNEMTVGGYVKAAGGGPANQVEVRVVDGAGTQVAQAYTNAAGYFYILGTALGGGNYKVGVRNGASATGMVAATTAGGCGANGCHVGGGQGDVHNP